MTHVSSPNPWLVVLCVFGSFAAGPLIGIFISHGVAPGSEIASLVSPLAFVAVFAGGMALWFGIGAAGMVGGAALRIVRPGGRGRAKAPSALPTGSGAFVPLGVGLGLIAGVIVGWVPQSTSFLGSFASHIAAGVAYGGGLRALARRGYLPFPEPE